MKVGFFGLLTILFTGLKLGGVIDWSWWVVLSPMYVTPFIVLSLLVTMALFYRK